MNVTIEAKLRTLRQLLGQLEGKIPHKDLREREQAIAHYHTQLANLERAIEQETELLLVLLVLNDQKS